MVTRGGSGSGRSRRPHGFCRLQCLVQTEDGPLGPEDVPNVADQAVATDPLAQALQAKGSVGGVVRGDEDDESKARPEGRIRNARKLLLAAAVIMSVLLMGALYAWRGDTFDLNLSPRAVRCTSRPRRCDIVVVRCTTM